MIRLQNLSIFCYNGIRERHLIIFTYSCKDNRGSKWRQKIGKEKRHRIYTITTQLWDRTLHKILQHQNTTQYHTRSRRIVRKALETAAPREQCTFCKRRLVKMHTCNWSQSQESPTVWDWFCHRLQLRPRWQGKVLLMNCDKKACQIADDWLIMLGWMFPEVETKNHLTLIGEDRGRVLVGLLANWQYAYRIYRIGFRWWHLGNRHEGLRGWSNSKLNNGLWIRLKPSISAYVRLRSSRDLSLRV